MMPVLGHSLRIEQFSTLSIAAFDWIVPIVIDKYGNIIAGFARYKAAKQLGLKTVPVMWHEYVRPSDNDEAFLGSGVCRFRY